MLPRDKEGLNFPNIWGYNLACLLRHIMDWLHESSFFSNWKIEVALTAPWSLQTLLHSRFSRIPALVQRSALLRDTIMHKAWKEVRKAHPFVQTYASVGSSRGTL